jgi:hypothetical protein
VSDRSNYDGGDIGRLKKKISDSEIPATQVRKSKSEIAAAAAAKESSHGRRPWFID